MTNAYFAKDKAIKNICNTLNGYLAAEKDLQKILDNGGDGYGYEDAASTKSSELSRDLDSQYKRLEKELKAFGFIGNPVEMIEIYAESRLKTIQILEGV